MTFGCTFPRFKTTTAREDVEPPNFEFPPAKPFEPGLFASTSAPETIIRAKEPKISGGPPSSLPDDSSQGEWDSPVSPWILDVGDYETHLGHAIEDTTFTANFPTSTHLISESSSSSRIFSSAAPYLHVPPNGEFQPRAADSPREWWCPNPDYGKTIKHLNSHCNIHQAEKPYICPHSTCRKGFAGIRRLNRHAERHGKALSNDKGNRVCIFCPGSGRTFTRLGNFKKHLAVVHEVDTEPPSKCSRKIPPILPPLRQGKCNVCSGVFADPQTFYDHLDDCALRAVTSSVGFLHVKDTGSSISQDPIHIHDSGFSKDTGMKTAEEEKEAGKDGLEQVDSLASPGVSQKGSWMSQAIVLGAPPPKPSSPSSPQPSSLVKPPPSASVPSHPTATIHCIEEIPVSSPSTPGGTSNSSSPESEISCPSPVSLHALMERKKSSLIDNVIDRLLACLEAKFTVLGYQSRGSDSLTSRPAATQGTQRAVAPSSQQPSFKHRRSSRDDGDDDDNPEDGGDGGDEWMRKKLKGQDEDKRRFACPFLKHNREKYKTWQSCVWSGFQTVHRVKEHLYRRHLVPLFRCLRCGDDMKSHEGLVAHLQATERCLAQPLQPDDRITVTQEQLLKSRKRRNMSEPEKWMEMYKILFPGDMIPSPYHEPPLQQPIPAQPTSQATVLSNFEHYARHEFSRQIRPELEAIIDRALQEQLSTDTVVTIAQGVLQRVIRSFEQDQLVPVSGGPMSQATGDLNTPSNQETLGGGVGARRNDVPQNLALHDVDNDNAGEHTTNDEDGQSNNSMANDDAPIGRIDRTWLDLNVADLFQGVAVNPLEDLSGTFDEWIFPLPNPLTAQQSDSGYGSIVSGRQTGCDKNPSPECEFDPDPALGWEDGRY